MSDLPPPPPPNMAPPPGYVAYGGYGQAQGSFRPIKGLSKWLVALLGITLGAQLLMVLVQLTLRDAAKDFIITNDITKFDDKLALFVGVGLLAAAVAVAEIVVMIIWTWRLAKNAQVLGRQPQSFGPGATIAINILGGCTLGILPFFMWRELWRASDPDVAPGDPRWKQSLVSVLIPVHLALVLGGAVAGFSLGVSNGVSPVRTSGSRADIAKNLNDRLGFIAVSGLLSVAASIVFLMIVRQLSARHMRATREA